MTSCPIFVGSESTEVRFVYINGSLTIFLISLCFLENLPDRNETG